MRSTRPLAHANIAPALLLGQALAFHQTGRFSWEMLLLAHAFGVADHLFIVWANDYADREADAGNATFNAYSGGSRVLPEGLLAPSTLLFAACAAALALLAISVAGAFLASPLMPALALLAVALLWAYSYPPLRLSYRGGGELLQGLGVGVVLPTVGYLAQAGELDSLPWLALVPTLVLAVFSNILTSLPDEPSDRRAQKRSRAVQVGGARARREALLGSALGIALAGVLVPADATLRLMVCALSLACLAPALLLVDRAEAHARQTCLVFITLVGAAHGVATLGLAIALFAGP